MGWVRSRGCYVMSHGFSRGMSPKVHHRQKRHDMSLATSHEFESWYGRCVMSHEISNGVSDEMIHETSAGTSHDGMDDS